MLHSDTKVPSWWGQMFSSVFYFALQRKREVLYEQWGNVVIHILQCPFKPSSSPLLILPWQFPGKRGAERLLPLIWDSGWEQAQLDVQKQSRGLRTLGMAKASHGPWYVHVTRALWGYLQFSEIKWPKRCQKPLQEPRSMINLNLIPTIFVSISSHLCDN